MKPGFFETWFHGIYIMSKQNTKNILLSLIILTALAIGGTAFSASFPDFFKDYFYFKPKAPDDGQTTDKPEIKEPIIKKDQCGCESESDKTARVVEQSLPAVVSIIATQELKLLPNSSFNNNFFFGFPFDFGLPQQPQQPLPKQAEPKTEKRQVSSGTGFIVSADGLVITNRHVVDNTEAQYSVILNTGETYEAEIIDRDTVNDLAVVNIKGQVDEKFPILFLGDSSAIKIGQTVLAIGNTLGEFRNTVSKGIISGINRNITAGSGLGQSEMIEGALQTDAAISAGNSGGPLVDLDGQVIGVNTAVSQAGENIGFAIPANEIKRVLDSVQKFGKIKRPFLGVRYLLLNKEIAEKNQMKIDYGALIVRGESREDLAVIPGSPADKTGLKENDVILEVNGQKVSAEQSLQKLLAQANIGDTVNLKIWRAGKEFTVQAIMEERE